MRRSRISGARYVEVRLRQLDLRRRERMILRNVSWTIRPGQRWVLAGANGAGKTQLLKLVSGAVWPADGRSSRRYRWRNEDFLSPFEVKEEIGYVGPERQDKYEHYGWNYTVEQIVGTGLYRTDIPLDPLSAGDRRRVAALLNRLAIRPLAGRRFLSLSYGERRLTLLARALASRPGLLLLDELPSGLDEVNRGRALQWLERTGRSDLPWVLATHRTEDVPRSATHALVLDKGRVVYSGTVRKAPLDLWLHESEPRGTHLPRIRRRRNRQIVRLMHASVYLDGHRVLENLSLSIRSGECWVVHGPNGSGKTTLLRTLYGDYGVAAGGRIERAGIQPGVPLQAFRRRVGLVAPHLQSEHPPDLTVAEVVRSGWRASIGVSEPPRAAERIAASRSLARFSLRPLAAQTLRELSYGQSRRVLFARAWVCRPRLLLLDEPYAGVDAPTRRDLMTLVEDAGAGAIAVVLATHHRREWPARTTHELELAAGRARYCGPVRSHIQRVGKVGVEP